MSRPWWDLSPEASDELDEEPLDDEAEHPHWDPRVWGR